MGFKYEMNWYLVVDSFNAVKESEGVFTFEKSENRIYPLDMPIPFIVKDKGICTGYVKIESILNSKDATEIKFKFYKVFKKDSLIGKHYYHLYREMKRDSES